MSFSDDFLDDIRSRVGLAELIGRQVKLTHRGHEFQGCCPFHQEKTPSFTVNEQKGFYHCFGCGAHGSIFDFVMQSERLSFPEAVERLATAAGLHVPRLDAGDAERARRRQSLFEVMDYAAAHFARNLKMPEGKPALEYLRGRGIDDAAITRFRLGFALPARGALKAALARDGIAEELMLEAGLLSRPDEGNGSGYDRFRGRVMFPISDRRGRVVGFGGRIIDAGEPKYLNSPETPLFHKGRLLYGLAEAAEAVRRTGRLIVVEGYMDVVGLALAGYDETVAPLGTALTEDQLQELWRLVPEPILCFDPDAAGRRASARICERALPLLRPGLGLRFAFPSAETGDDPDQLVRRYPRQFIARTLAEAVPLSQMLLWLETEGRAPATAEARAATADRLRQRASTIADAGVREQFLASFRQALRPRFVPSAPARRRGGAAPSPPPVAVRPGDGRSPRYDAERTLLAILCRHPDFFDEVEEEFGTVSFHCNDHDLLRQALISILSGRNVCDEDCLREELVKSDMKHILDSVIRDPVILTHKYIMKTASLSAVRAAWRQHIVSIYHYDEIVESAPTSAVTTTDECLKHFSKKAARLKAPIEEADIDQEDWRTCERLNYHFKKHNIHKPE